jgi:hypothetical protein
MRHLLIFVFYLDVFLGSTGARAQEFAAAVGHTGVGHCHMDTCSFFHIVDSKPVGSATNGTLYTVALQQWENEYRAKGENDDHEYDRAPITTGKPSISVSFVFCSKTRPLQFFFSEGKWDANSLRPGDEAAVSGAEEFAYVLYWAECHELITKDPVSAALATRLGYRFKDQPANGGNASGATSALQPMDVLR